MQYNGLLLRRSVTCRLAVALFAAWFAIGARGEMGTDFPPDDFPPEMDYPEEAYPPDGYEDYPEEDGYEAPTYLEPRQRRRDEGDRERPQKRRRRSARPRDREGDRERGWSRRQSPTVSVHVFTGGGLGFASTDEATADDFRDTVGLKQTIAVFAEVTATYGSYLGLNIDFSTNFTPSVEIIDEVNNTTQLRDLSYTFFMPALRFRYAFGSGPLPEFTVFADAGYGFASVSQNIEQNTVAASNSASGGGLFLGAGLFYQPSALLWLSLDYALSLGASGIFDPGPEAEEFSFNRLRLNAAVRIAADWGLIRAVWLGGHFHFRTLSTSPPPFTPATDGVGGSETSLQVMASAGVTF